jgi:Zn-dependent protease
MHRCDTCGLRSDIDDFFRSEKGGLLDFKKPVCEGCRVYAPTPYQRRAFAFQFGPYIGIGVLLAMIWERSGTDGMMVATMAVAAFVSLPLRSLTHEAGHALVAKLLGREIIDVTLGSGPLWMTTRICGMMIAIRCYLFTGAAVRYFDMKGRSSRWATAAIIVAGPAANLVFAGVAFWVCVYRTEPGTIETDFITTAIAGVALAQVFMAVANLIPMRGGENNMLKSDGQRLLGLIRSRPRSDPGFPIYQRIVGLIQSHRFEEGAKVALGAVDSSDHVLFVMAQALHCVSRARGDAAAVNCYLEHAHDVEQAIGRGGEVDLDFVPLLQANVAWSALKADRKDLHDLVARFSQEALEAFPAAPEMRGTQGAWLIENGNYQEGLALLTEAVRTVVDPLDKADFCIFLARGWKALGDMSRSEGYAQLREHLIGRHSAGMVFAAIST